MSASSEQSLREIATHLQSIDDSLKTIAKSTRRTTWTNDPERTKSDATAGAVRPGADYVGPYGSGPEPYS